MHSCPTPSERYLFLKQDRLKIYTFGLVSTLFIVTGNLLFIYAFPFFIPYLITTAITVFYLALSYLVGFRGRQFNYAHHSHLQAKWFDKCAEAVVDIYLPVCREPLDVIFNTWEHVSIIRMYHPGVQYKVLVSEGNERDAVGFVRLDYKLW